MDTGGSNGSRPRNNNVGKKQQVRAGGLKRGHWTPEEDAVLKDYVTKNGGGKWDVVRKICGLNRCGKSCRLRWINHLQPNLKKGAISPEEEATIVRLHAKYGNSWARITSELPGRTDNDVKNFWNTRLKKMRKANLPMYPTRSEEEEIKNHMKSTPKISNSPSSSTLQSSHCITTFIQPHAHEHFYNNISHNNMLYVSNNNFNQNYTDFNYQNNNYNAFALTGQHNVGFVNNNHSSSISAFSSGPVTQFKNFDLGSNPNPTLFGSKIHEQNGQQVVYTTPPQVNMFNQHSNVDYEQNGHQVVFTTPSQDDILNQQSNDLVIQAKTLCENSHKKIDVNQIHDQEYLWDYKIDEELPITLQDLSLNGEQNFIQERHFHESSSSLLSMGTKVATTSSMETNVVDINLFNTLGNSPVINRPMPVWYNGAGPVPTENWQELLNSSKSMAMEASQAVMDDSGNWNIMPGVHSNLMEMETSQPFMESSSNWNIIPGVHQSFSGNDNMSGIQW